MTAGKNSAQDASKGLLAPSRRCKCTDKASKVLPSVASSLMQAIKLEYNPRCCFCNALSALHILFPRFKLHRGEPADMRSPLSFEGTL